MSETNVNPPSSAPTGSPSTSGSDQNSSNRSNSRPSRGGRNNRNPRTTKPKFKGETESMNGHVFQSPDESKDATQFTKTLEALEHHCTITYQSDFSSVFMEPPNCVLPSVDKPSPPSANATQFNKDLYPLLLKQYLSKKDKLHTELKALWSVMWGQCSNSIVTKLEDIKDIKKWKKSADVVSLMNEIQLACLNFDRRASPFTTLHKHLAFLYAYRQKEKDDIHRYLEIFKLVVENIQRYGGSIGRHPAFIKQCLINANVLDADASDHDYTTKFDSLSPTDKEKYSKESEDISLATAFLMGGRPERYGELLIDLQNQYLIGADNFPRTLTQAYNVMANFIPKTKPSAQANQHNVASNASVYSLGMGMTFFQTNVTDDQDQSSNTHSDSIRHGKGIADKNDLVPGTNGVLFKNVRCYRCNYFGHYADRCSVVLMQKKISSDAQTSVDDDTSSNASRDSVGFSFYQMNVTLTQVNETDRYKGLKTTWVLLDTQSSCDIFANEKLLKNIHDVDRNGLLMQSNGGNFKATQMGTVKGYGKVWYNQHSLANILSFANVRKKFPITVVTGPNDPCPTICVHRPDGSTMKFREISMGLYVFDTELDDLSNELDTDKHSKSHSAYSFVQSVELNSSNFTPRQIKSADNALLLYKRLGRPAQKDFVRYLEQNLIRNSEVTSLDAKRAFYIYGPDTATC